MNLVYLKDVGVYHDSDTTHWHFGRIQEYTGYVINVDPYIFLKPESINQFIQSTLSVKIAAFHVAFPPNNDWLERFHILYPHVTHTVIACSELHELTYNQLQQLDLPNVSIFVCGFLNHNFTSAKIYNWMDWFITAGDFYRNIKPSLLAEKLISGKKEKYFDVLLGCQRTHRDYVNAYINENIPDKTIMTYFKRWNVDLRTTDHIFESEGLEFIPESNYYHTVHRVKYYGHNMNLSAIVPIEVYNKTYYSLVTETNSINSFNFYTEKIVKPILAGRLFIVVAGAGYLRNLRSLGFKTFDGVIDESYDLEEDNVQRWALALEQVRWLCNQDPESILKQIAPIVYHNRQLMLEDWNKKFILQLTAVIEQYLTTACIIAH